MLFNSVLFWLPSYSIWFCVLVPFKTIQSTSCLCLCFAFLFIVLMHVNGFNVFQLNGRLFVFCVCLLFNYCYVSLIILVMVLFIWAGGWVGSVFVSFICFCLLATYHACFVSVLGC